MATSLIERFWRHVSKSEGCWLWTGYVTPNGYGVITQDPTTKKRVQLYAHRLSWHIHNGVIPLGLNVLHHCDTRNCVRPSHLFIGTHKTNSEDMVAKGRNKPGELRWNAALTDEQARRVLLDFQAGVSRKELMHKYGVPRWVIYSLVTRQTWKHIHL